MLLAVHVDGWQVTVALVEVTTLSGFAEEEMNE